MIKNVVELDTPHHKSNVNSSLAVKTSSHHVKPGIQVECLVKTRIPTTEFGTFHVLLYRTINKMNSIPTSQEQGDEFNGDTSRCKNHHHNNNMNHSLRHHNRILYNNSSLKEDTEEHLAFVYGNDIISTSLNKIIPGETQRDRAVRGASLELPTSFSVSEKEKHQTKHFHSVLCRIHSSCFTGETICSARCDCSDQLYQAMRQIHQQGSGVILYLRQEGRGIGLLDKLKAYNLQDMGYDTVTANELLNHPPDARTYSVAVSILRDLNIQSIKLLTNNPDKIEQMKLANIEIIERIPMLPDHWGAAFENSQGALLDEILPCKKQRILQSLNYSGHRMNCSDRQRDNEMVESCVRASNGNHGSKVMFNTVERVDSEESTSHESLNGIAFYSQSMDASETNSVTSVESWDPNLIKKEMDRYMITKIKKMNHLLHIPPSISRSIEVDRDG